MRSRVQVVAVRCCSLSKVVVFKLWVGIQTLTSPSTIMVVQLLKDDLWLHVRAESYHGVRGAWRGLPMKLNSITTLKVGAVQSA
jgi:hypothetical protein